MRLQSKRYQVRPHKSDYLRIREQVIAILAVIAVLVFMKVWQKVNVDHQIRRNDKLAQELLVLQGETALLEVRIDELRSMQRMGELAESRLKLVPVPTIVLKEKGMVGKLVDKLEDWQR
ncbi:MAG TPA: hypothetical protein PKI81_02440 [bacterium]|nr:hypothetical protein [bacterium]HOC90448.1 hypothetical protein [bacterium]HOZ20728.1 hypothetical protein [bacterium]